MIKYILGNVFDHNFLDEKIYLIPHVCNNIGGFGSGFAGYLAKNYPIVRENYISWHQGKDCSKRFELGAVQYVNIKPNVQVCNMISQHQVISMNPKPIRYASLVKCMEDVLEQCMSICLADVLRYDLELNYNKVEIVCPMFGSGLAGGNWNFIHELIEEIWNQFNVVVYDFEGKVVKGE